MKKAIIILALLGAFFWQAAVCMAAMGPERGLPVVVQWGVTFRANASSAMCVECHTENPSRSIFNAALPFLESETLYRGSHFVRNDLDATDRVTNNKSFEKLDAWALTDELSKYGNDALQQSVTGVQGEMICESCHNLLVNTGDSLLLETYDEALGDVALCLGCHAFQAAGPPNHHPMSGHLVGGDTGANPCSTGPHLLNPDNTTRLRDPIVSKSDTLNVGFATDATPVQEMSCASCHKPHDAMTATGARILRRGSSQSTFLWLTDGQVNIIYADGVPDPTVFAGDVLERHPTGVAATGIHRQSDMDAGKRLVTNYDPLCQSCH